METILIVSYVVGILAVFFGGIAWMIHVQISPVKKSVNDVKELLTNHITDTNKKIDKLSDRFDRQNDQFVRLYEILIRKENK